jgi:hypothetical protein
LMPELRGAESDALIIPSKVLRVRAVVFGKYRARTVRAENSLTFTNGEK